MTITDMLREHIEYLQAKCDKATQQADQARHHLFRMIGAVGCHDAGLLNKEQLADMMADILHEWRQEDKACKTSGSSD